MNGRGPHEGKALHLPGGQHVTSMVSRPPSPPDPVKVSALPGEVNVTVPPKRPESPCNFPSNTTVAAVSLPPPPCGGVFTLMKSGRGPWKVWSVTTPMFTTKSPALVVQVPPESCRFSDPKTTCALADPLQNWAMTPGLPARDASQPPPAPAAAWPAAVLAAVVATVDGADDDAAAEDVSDGVVAAEAVLAAVADDVVAEVVAADGVVAADWAAGEVAGVPPQAASATSNAGTSIIFHRRIATPSPAETD